MRLHTERAQGMVGDHHATFIPTHREDNDTPIVMQVSMSVPVSLEDIEAVFWIAVNGGMLLDERELGNDQYAHEMVLETFLHEGSNRICLAREEIEDIKPGSGDYALLMMIRRRVAELYGRPGVPAPRRALTRA
ncbi:hypothetical protein A8924_0868 [Saccharopolyspora erythraea NRRL 2338]|uniref:Uncharacterized protein n=2 Tax=Saccharopolyspora erythraea TaxID=1836 RepID=A4F6Z5_SACEN|nr:hypothetical protein [Saccharopolyspora erythraea]PFG93618.1 hypothetical protein A8924_0868 [Saccharopolyspora erythraea NRRL 2338]QRK93193.1 hypothetical protein JQX30_01340 [Saccharopolyspora erythraea]QRK93255.1 hypothetical protein JQX30_02845 [Saccharopolyspora erythraea]QRK93259.1 hypothetical protein JQX30_02915 [Saccharopolyspora erythraea]CAL99819.1 hypothetical protein SACE_0470 [Saccharopolyspora erythraea NRRL 2338]